MMNSFRWIKIIGLDIVESAESDARNLVSLGDRCESLLYAAVDFGLKVFNKTD